jgi:hypothetical protein
VPSSFGVIPLLCWGQLGQEHLTKLLPCIRLPKTGGGELRLPSEALQFAADGAGADERWSEIKLGIVVVDGRFRSYLHSASPQLNKACQSLLLSSLVLLSLPLPSSRLSPLTPSIT